MDQERVLESGSKSWATATADGVRSKLFAGENKPSFSRAVIERLQQELKGLWSSGVQKPTCFPNPLYGESSFRFLLANEVKRSERSGHSFHVLLMYFAEAHRGPTRIDNQMTNTLVPILSNMLRETDYLGWYRENQILGVVLTALREKTDEEVSSRIEQRFWLRMGEKLQVKDFARLRVRLVSAQEFGYLESTNSLFTAS
jgi:hypothetical protein